MTGKRVTIVLVSLLVTVLFVGGVGLLFGTLAMLFAVVAAAVVAAVLGTIDAV